MEVVASLKVAQLLRSAACLHTNQSRSYLNHLVHKVSKSQESLNNTKNIISTTEGGCSTRHPLSIPLSSGTVPRQISHMAGFNERMFGTIRNKQFAIQQDGATDMAKDAYLMT